MRIRVARPLRIVLGTMLLTAPALAKKDPRLDRMEPVPSDQPIPIIDFFRPPVFASPRLNPAGDHFAALISTGDDTVDLAVFELPSMRIDRLSGRGDEDITRFEWQNDHRLVFEIVRSKRYPAGIFATEIKSLSHIYTLEEYNDAVLVGFPLLEPNNAVIWIRRSQARAGGDGGLFKINTGRGLLTKRGGLDTYLNSGIKADIVHLYPRTPPGSAVAFLSDCVGEPAFAVTIEEDHYALRHLNDNCWQQVPVDLLPRDIVGPGDESEELIVVAPGPRGHPRPLRRLEVNSGKLGETLAEDAEYDLFDAHLYRDPKDRRILGIQYDRSGPTSVWLDPGYRAIQAGLDALFPGRVARILGSDLAGKRFFVGVGSDVSPTSYHFVDTETHTSRLIANVRPWIESTRMQPMRLLHYPSRDGHRIDGYLTLPEGASKTSPAALVVLPHGGPWQRNTWGWHPQAQFLASRGYAVFQPNFRGSLGSEWSFSEEDRWAYRKMHDDITDGVHALASTGLIDPDRVAILGASFGGYLALCGAAYEPELYRCVITVGDMVKSSNAFENNRRSAAQPGFYGVLRHSLAHPDPPQSGLNDLSPLGSTDGIEIPMFSSHDAQTSMVRPSELIAKSENNHVPYLAEVGHSDDRGFRRLKHQVEAYAHIERFLAEHLAIRSQED